VSNIHAIAVPKWGIEMTEGTLTGWSKEVGDSIAKGDEVFDMESDKIINVWEAPVDGVLRRRLAEEGESLPVGTLLGVIAAADVDDAEIDKFIADFGGSEEIAAAPEAAAAPAAASRSDAESRVNPVVRKLAAELGVDLNAVEGTGRRGRITKEDVEAAAQAAKGDSGADADVDIAPLSPIRKTTARRLAEAKREIPHFYLTVDYVLDGLMANRKALNDEGGQRVSVNDLMVWCVAQALMDEPGVNVNLVGDDVHTFKQANVSVAIATDDGLFPVTVYGAEGKSPQEIAAATAALADKAKNGKLAAADLSNGSFTVSNLGMFGIKQFTAIVNPPMGAILALGKAEPRVVVEDGAPAVKTVVSATLSCDHRVIDGAAGARYLAALGKRIAELS
jgi:pyruvate dehydrogenase E2 component (dihydrolipoamide acetyltransferase)